MNDSVRELCLSKELSELLASRLNEKKLLQHGTKVTFYCSREKDILQYFRVDSDLVYCHDVSGLLNAMGVTPYDPNEWRLLQIVQIGVSSVSYSIMEIHMVQFPLVILYISKKKMDTSKSSRVSQI